MSAATQTAAQGKKATRRSPNNWTNGNPRPRITRRWPAAQSEPSILRYPMIERSAATVTIGHAPIVKRLESVQSGWTARERELRRLQAIRKQEELLMLIADADLEDLLRSAVADGEQPILPPELEALRN